MGHAYAEKARETDVHRGSTQGSSRPHESDVEKAEGSSQEGDLEQEGVKPQGLAPLIKFRTVVLIRIGFGLFPRKCDRKIVRIGAKAHSDRLTN